MILKNLLVSLRPKQWIKNLFVILPIIFGRKLFVSPENINTVIAFLLFCMASGVVYVMNDILDVEKDKLHPDKKQRPIASGRVTVRHAAGFALLLGCLSILFSFLLDKTFGWTIIVYLVFNLLYTRVLKEAVIIDVFCIGVFFLLRILAGGVVAKTGVSHWILFMTTLLALFLGFSKRRQELSLYGKTAASHRSVLAKYNPYFIDQMVAVITSSIVIAYMLYTVDGATVGRFGTDHLMFSIPFVYYGIFRYLYLIHEKHQDADPTRLLLSDGKMQINLALWVAVCVGVIYFGV